MALNSAAETYAETGSASAAANAGSKEFFTALASGALGRVAGVAVTGALAAAGTAALPAIVIGVGAGIGISIVLDEGVFDPMWDDFPDMANRVLDVGTAAANWTIDAGEFALNSVTQGYRDTYAYLFDGTFSGTPDVDTFNGGPCDDTLIGRGGNDMLTGGWGEDTFRFVTPAEGVDTITDFDSGTDEIEVVSSNFGNLEPGSLSLDHFWDTSSNTNPRFLYAAIPGFTYDRGMLSFDQDGNGSRFASMPIANLGPDTILRHTDIQIVAA